MDKNKLKQPFQLNLFDKSVPIETIVISPTKDMPLDLFKHCHRLAYFMELMDRLPDGRIIWNPDVTEIYSEDLAEAEYFGIQQGWFSVNMELPKDIFSNEVLEEN